MGDTTETDLSVGRINAALAPGLGGAQVVGVTVRPIGTGQMADSVRLTLEYDRPGAGPSTVVAKFASQDPTSLATALMGRNYEIETSFYRELRESLPVRAPHCHFVEFDPSTGMFLLLLEDLAPARQGDQLAGCSPEHAERAVAELPKLHGPRWGDPTLAHIGWLHRSTPDSALLLQMLVSAKFPEFCTRYEGRIDHDILAMGERYVAALGRYISRRPDVWTIAHGDYRLDNLLFGTPEGGPPVGVVDWQTVAHGPGIADLSYFLGAGLLPDDRRAHEVALVRRYQEGMRAFGVDLDWDELWRQYRFFTFSGFNMAVVASMIVKQTERGDDMFVVMAQRHGRHALDLEAEEFLA